MEVSMLVESNPTLPFIDMREYDESLIDVSTLMSAEYVRRSSKSEDTDPSFDIRMKG